LATTIYTSDALDTLDRLWNDDTRTASLVENALDVLESDPADPRCRAVSLRPRPGEQIWGMPLRAPSEDWLILWHYRDNQQTVAVLYIGINFIH
jgi:hypothetical protein